MYLGKEHTTFTSMSQCIWSHAKINVILTPHQENLILHTNRTTAEAQNQGKGRLVKSQGTSTKQLHPLSLRG